MISLIDAVRELCEREGVEFLFITSGKSCWSVDHDEHIREVVNFHKYTEENHSLIRRDFYDLS